MSMVDNDKVQKRNLFVPILLISIGILGFIFFICLQMNFIDFNHDDNFYVLNTSVQSISFEEGMNFIFNTQLSRVTVIEKWVVPIKIKYEGNPTKDDIRVLNRIIQDFNSVNGFPGMEIVNKNENVLLIYASQEDLPEIQQKYNIDVIDMGICQRFSENGEIHQAIIIIESDVNQKYKNSVVLHEIFHMVGFYNHVYDNSSILNQLGAPVPGLSGIDTLAFKMLYNPEIPVGMRYSEMGIYYREKC